MENGKQDEPVEPLVRAAQQGDAAAFRQLYDRYRDVVYKTAYRLIGSRQDAEDVTQEVFVTIYRRLSTFDFRSSFKAWCYRITVNACYDRLRKRQRRAPYRGGNPDVETGSSLFGGRSGGRLPDDELARLDIQYHTEQALQKLKPDLRTALVLKEMQGLSYKEIASVLDCSEGTVASRLARARQQVAAYLRSVGIDESYYE